MHCDEIHTQMDTESILFQPYFELFFVSEKHKDYLAKREAQRLLDLVYTASKATVKNLVIALSLL